MEITKIFFVLLSFFLLQMSAFGIKKMSALAKRKSYVVYMGAHSHGPEATLADYERATEMHHSLLESFLGSKERAKDAIIYSYQKHINGFVAKLHERHALAISKHPDVVSVFLDGIKELHITHSWEFMGLERDGIIPKESIWRKANFGEDVIIATLDSGVWAGSDCFKDEGMGPVPKRWKGSCSNNTKGETPCNRKLIGAKYFKDGYTAFGNAVDCAEQTPVDFDGHGTHTLSTIGCRFALGANGFNHANGTAKGGSPAARVATYKVCWGKGLFVGCAQSDILAAVDEAIHDGVDVLSFSFGGSPQPFLEDGEAIGAFHAVMNGIAVVCSAGNDGPQPATASNIAPWMITVAASTLDREFPSYVRLGDNQQLRGQSLSPDALQEKMYPLIYSKDAGASSVTADSAEQCEQGSLDPEKVKGKIVVCPSGQTYSLSKSQSVQMAGGAGVILANDVNGSDHITADAFFVPAVQITYSDGLKLFSYMNSTKSPMAYIAFAKTAYGKKPNPQMADFSSQGPNVITPEILKPDITAPGVQILAAYSPYNSPTDFDSFDDLRREPYTFLSGTSMSCPHVSGTVGLLKVLHPDWTSAAIRSAIMTSARGRDNNAEAISDGSWGPKANPFNYGAGHLRPNRAMDPGLIYDITVDEYFNFMCALGYNSTQLDVLRKHKCPPPPKAISPLDLNYPSITVPQLTHDGVLIKRRVKNVGPPSTYKAHVQSPPGVSVVVHPQTLIFNRTGEEQSFQLILRPKYGLLQNYTFGRLIWSDAVHHVRSPISVSSVPIPFNITKPN